VLLEQEIEKLQREWPMLHISEPPALPLANEDNSDGEHDPHALILNMSAILNLRDTPSGLQCLCIFSPLDLHSLVSDKLMLQINNSCVIKMLVDSQAHVTIPPDQNPGNLSSNCECVV
jgi:hypothetical protein